MSSLYSVAEVINPTRHSLSEKFEWRLRATLLATVLDFAVLAIFGPIVFHCASISAAWPVAFSILALAMLVSLAHMWLLALRAWNS